MFSQPILDLLPPSTLVLNDPRSFAMQTECLSAVGRSVSNTVPEIDRVVMGKASRSGD